MVFSKKWVRNHEKIVLHFLIHIDVLMLCSKFEPILTSIFRVTVILKNEPKSDGILLRKVELKISLLMLHVGFR